MPILQKFEQSLILEYLQLKRAIEENLLIDIVNSISRLSEQSDRPGFFDFTVIGQAVKGIYFTYWRGDYYWIMARFYLHQSSKVIFRWQ